MSNQLYMIDLFFISTTLISIFICSLTFSTKISSTQNSFYTIMYYFQIILVLILNFKNILLLYPTSDSVIGMSLLLMSVLPISVLGIAIGLSFSYWKQLPNSSWMSFRIWHAICLSAHIKPCVMIPIIGRSALMLLESVANLEPRPWTIAEYLEKLKQPS